MSDPCYVCKDDPKFRPFCSRCAGTGRHAPTPPSSNDVPDWRAVITEMGERFTSGNSVPVERAMIRRVEWESVLQRLHEALPDETSAEHLLRETRACFEAAIAEGWHDALASGDITRIRDLWERRLSFAFVDEPRPALKTNGDVP